MWFFLIIPTMIALWIVVHRYKKYGKLDEDLSFLRHRWGRAAAWAFLFFMLTWKGCGAIGFYGFVRGKVVDAETGAPLPGANVVAIHEQECFTVGGEVSYFVKPRETVTDSEGEFFFLPRATWLFPVSMCEFREDQFVVVFPEYHIFPEDVAKTTFNPYKETLENYNKYSPYNSISIRLMKIRPQEYADYYPGSSDISFWGSQLYDAVNARQAYEKEGKRVHGIRLKIKKPGQRGAANEE